MPDHICLCSVVTNFKQYAACIADNPFLAQVSRHYFDNTAQNKPVSARYNEFIEQQMPENAWVIFCHQDFEFLQDPADVLKTLDKNTIYGPIGVAREEKKIVSLIFHTWRRPSLKTATEIRARYYGQILQGIVPNEKKIGQKLIQPKEVDTLDCCCLIAHSTLIRQKNLRFDPTFDFHLYSEDFSLAARHKNVSTKAVQIACRHLSGGNTDKLFWQRYELLLKKYPNDIFLTTCVGDYTTFIQRKTNYFQSLIASKEEY